MLFLLISKIFVIWQNKLTKPLLMNLKLFTLLFLFCGITYAQEDPKKTDNEKANELDEIVISASRTPEKVKESPVTIERMSIRDIKKTASPSFYDGLENLKEVQMNTSSLSFKSINTRGFATVANTRFMQLVDGMDNSSPLLNFVLGNMIGISEIDVQSVELLPGASSALYGANAFNGILFMNSKNPFTNQGITAYAKYGNTSQKAAGSNDFYDYGVRVAHAFSPKFAAKANFTFMKGTDWYATNYDDKTRPGITRADKDYDGINVYGDDVNQSMFVVGTKVPGVNTNAAMMAHLATQGNISRTGYNEVDLTDNVAKNAKVDFSLHYRPFANEKLEIIWQSKFGTGNAVYQGANRYYLNNFNMQQHKLELKGKNFFLRGYTTTEDGGRSYDMNFAARNINNTVKSNNQWLGEYVGSYAQAYAGAFGAAYAGNSTASHAFARAFADTGRLIPGTTAFKAAFDKVIADPDVLTGSRLVDNSRIYHSDVNYNLKDLVKFAEIQVGGSYREYQLNSHGRIYTDATSPINYNEYGVYTQVQKKVMDDKLKLVGSVRYDKAQNFSGNFSPRASVVYSPTKDHSFRASFQTGFRNPTTQDQYIGFNVGDAVLIGSAADNLTRYSETIAVANGPATWPLGTTYAGGANVTINGTNAYYNSYTVESFKEFLPMLLANQTPAGLFAASAKLKKANVSLVKPETVKAFDAGYRGTYGGFSIDINGYYNIYNDFLGNATVITPLYGEAADGGTFNPALGAPAYITNKPVQSLHALSNGNFRAFQLYTNTEVEIKSLGFGMGISKKVYKDFELSANYNYAEFDFDQAKDPNFEAGFNTPKQRIKGSISNDNLFPNFGFNLSARWNSEYKWESTMVDGMIDAATVIDAQVSYTLTKLKSTIKVGAANLGGKEYTQVLGAGAIGQQYFASWTINP